MNENQSDCVYRLMRRLRHAAIWLILTASTVSTANSNEANLLAVAFIDPDRGWVAGERGTILHTEDGGTTWKSQSSNTQATLTAVAMYNSQRGVAVGGSYQPYTQLSIGAVVITKDGGETWIPSDGGHDLPRLRKLLIGPGGKCVAVGDWSLVHLTSVFESDDGGQTWRPRPCHIVGSAIGLAGTVDDFLVLSESGEIVRFRQDADPQTLFPADREWRMIVGDDVNRVIVGARGAIRSSDRGETWQHLSQGTGTPFSLRPGEQAAANLRGDDLWVIKDGQSSISLLHPNSSTTCPHPGQASIRSLLRLDRDRGWAVGDLGLIQSTRDGGQTWRVLRGGEMSPAVMFVGSRGDTLPWSLMAQESLQHQRRISLVIDRENEEIATNEYEQLVDASSTLGPVTFFATDSDRARISDILRLSKPAVVVLDQSLWPSQKANWTAAAAEADVQRVLEVGVHGSQMIYVTSAIPAAGILASDVWVDAIARLAPGQLPPTKLMLTPLLDASNDNSDGLASCVHGDARYRWSRATTASRRQLQILQARVAEMTWIESLLSDTRSATEFKQLLEPVLQRMSAADRERMFARLIVMTGGQPRHQLYVATLESLVEKATQIQSSDNMTSNVQLRLARLQLDAIQASAEWRQTFGTTIPMLPSPTAAAAATPSPISLAVQISPFQSPHPSDGNPGGTQRADLTNRVDAVRSQAVELASGQATTIPTSTQVKEAPVDSRWQLHPAVLMVAANVERDTQRLLVPIGPVGNDPTFTDPPSAAISATSANLRRLTGLVSAGRWGVLTTDNRLPDTIHCPIATSQPYLDGSFDEPWWQGGQPFGVAHAPVMLRMAHDNDFIYVGVDAGALGDSSHDTEVRQRDTPLDRSDRYRIRIDLDRDLMTAYEFEFDGDGNTRDSCDGFLAFQPRWFIACKQVGDRTRAEIAIHKADIGLELAGHGVTWNVSIDHLNRKTALRGLSLPDPEAWRPVLLE